MKGVLKLLAALGVIAAIVLTHRLTLQAGSVGAGYAAKQICSGMFVARLPEQFVLETDVLPRLATVEPLAKLLGYEVNYGHREVAARMLGQEVTARHRRGYGCTLVTPDHAPLFPFVAAADGTSTHPFSADAALAPEEISDSDYSERLALFEEQNSFIEALGQQFSQGINGGKPFNGKDLLTEMMLSPWFTAAGIEDGVTSTPAAIGNIGARRLLTPEELEAKSYSLLGRRWGEDSGSNPTYKYDRLITKLLDVYPESYGGIDSKGILERTRSMTAIMANIAERKALEMACPVVIMDFARPKSERLIFAGIEPEIGPDTEGTSTHVVSAEDIDSKQTFVDKLALTSGQKTLSVEFLNDFWQQLEDGTAETSDLFITDIEVIDQNGKLILDADFSQYNPNNLLDGVPVKELSCGDYWFSDDSFKFWGSGCSMDIPLNINVSGEYTVSISAWGVQAGGELTKLGVTVKSDAQAGQSNGARQIKSQIVDLYNRFHGATVDIDDPDVDLAYELMIDAWQERKSASPDTTRTAPYDLYNCVWNDWSLRQQYFETDQDPAGMKYAWMSMIISLMIDFNYLHE